MKMINQHGEEIEVDLSNRCKDIKISINQPPSAVFENRNGNLFYLTENEIIAKALQIAVDRLNTTGK